VAEEIAEFTERATPLAQLITKCTVPNTVALTFDDGPEQYIRVCAPVK
jgi:peptidoglycan/xylan/chitin deacetylase (PgdA/CDA1 family)